MNAQSYRIEQGSSSQRKASVSAEKKTQLNENWTNRSLASSVFLTHRSKEIDTKTRTQESKSPSSTSNSYWSRKESQQQKINLSIKDPQQSQRKSSVSIQTKRDFENVYPNQPQQQMYQQQSQLNAGSIKSLQKYQELKRNKEEKQKEIKERQESSEREKQKQRQKTMSDPELLNSEKRLLRQLILELEEKKLQKLHSISLMQKQQPQLQPTKQPQQTMQDDNTQRSLQFQQSLCQTLKQERQKLQSYFTHPQNEQMKNNKEVSAQEKSLSFEQEMEETLKSLSEFEKTSADELKKLEEQLQAAEARQALSIEKLEKAKEKSSSNKYSISHRKELLEQTISLIMENDFTLKSPLQAESIDCIENKVKSFDAKQLIKEIDRLKLQVQLKPTQQLSASYDKGLRAQIQELQCLARSYLEGEQHKKEDVLNNLSGIPWPSIIRSLVDESQYLMQQDRTQSQKRVDTQMQQSKELKQLQKELENIEFALKTGTETLIVATRNNTENTQSKTGYESQQSETTLLPTTQTRKVISQDQIDQLEETLKLHENILALARTIPRINAQINQQLVSMNV